MAHHVREGLGGSHGFRTVELVDGELQVRGGSSRMTANLLSSCTGNMRSTRFGDSA